MNEAINFELVSPEERLVSEPVKLAVLPGTEGEMGVGAGHSAYVVALKAGVVSLYHEREENPRRIFIAGGFADITGENCVVLAEEAVNVKDMNEDDLNQEIKNLKEDLGVASSDIEKSRIARKLELAKIKLEAVTGKVEMHA
jgi:F-type H+-transporting ATPase subunit epsilon